MQFGLAAFAELPLASEQLVDRSVINQIRASAVDILTGLDTTGLNVFSSRVHNLEEVKLPALLLYIYEEESQPLTISVPRTIEKIATLHLEGYVKQNANYDDKVDDIAQEVEEALYTNRTLNGLVLDSFLRNTEVEYESNGDNPLARVVMDFEICYHHLEGNL